MHRWVTAKELSCGLKVKTMPANNMKNGKYIHTVMKKCFPTISFREIIYKGSPRTEKQQKELEKRDKLEYICDGEYKNPWYTYRLTPSELRKQARERKANAERHHLCIMGAGQIIGRFI